MAAETNKVTHQGTWNNGLNQNAESSIASLHGHDAAVAAAMLGSRSGRTGNMLSTASR